MTIIFIWFRSTAQNLQMPENSDNLSVQFKWQPVTVGLFLENWSLV